jgi:hypothetical protein
MESNVGAGGRLSMKLRCVTLLYAFTLFGKSVSPTHIILKRCIADVGNTVQVCDATEDDSCFYSSLTKLLLPV